MRKNNKNRIAAEACSLLLLLVFFLLVGKIAAADLYLNSKTGSIFLNTTESSRLQVEAGGNLVLLGNANVTFPANLTVDSGTLFVDSVNNNVGIGTLSPSEKLVVIGNVNISGTLNVSGRVSFSNLANCNTVDTDANGVLSCGTDEGGSSSLSNSTSWNRTGTNVVLANTEDFVGIGTTSPTNKLHISTSNGDILIGDITASSSTDSGLTMNGSGSFQSAIFTEVNGQVLSYGINVPQLTTRNTTRSGGIFRLDIRDASPPDGKAFVIYSYQSNSSTATQRFWVNLDNGTTALVPSGGNVGIGTTTPNQKLVVVGDINVTGTSYLGNLDFSGSTINAGTVISENINATYLNTSGQTLLAVLGGNVGIGTASPAVKLVVAGSANITDDLISKTLYDVSSQGLFLAMNFNNESIDGDTILDSSIYNNHGTNSGATFNSTGGFDNLGSGAFSFNGTNNTIQLPNTNFPFVNQASYSIIFWINAKSIPTNKISYLFWRNDDTPGIRFHSDGKFYFMSDGNNLKNVTFGFTPSDFIDKWTQIGMTYNNIDGNISAYINGNLNASLSGQSIVTGTSSQITYIGWDGAAGRSFNGTIDEFRVYSRQLSADEIKRLYLQRAELPNSFVSQRDVYVDSSGKVGIGTTSPNYLLQVASGTDGRSVNLSNVLY